MTLESLNDFIEELVNNGDFNDMLTGKVRLLDDRIVQLLNNQLLNQYAPYDKRYNFKSLKNLRIEIQNDDYKNFIVDFYTKIDVSGTLVNSILQNKLIIQQNENFRAVTTQDGMIKIKEFDKSLGWLVALIHEMAHAISKINSPGSEPLFAEVEAKVTEIAFYRYLIDNKINIIKEANNVPRPLTSLEVEEQKFLEMSGEREILRRYVWESAVVNELRSNLRHHGTYTFTPLQFSSFTALEKQKILATIPILKDNYFGRPNRIDENGYNRLDNGCHLANEYRFVVARLFTEYAYDKPDILDKVGNYLLSGEFKSSSFLQKFFGFQYIDELVKAEISNYQKLYVKVVSEDDIFFKKDWDRRNKLSHFAQMSLEDQTIYEKMMSQAEPSKPLQSNNKIMRRVLTKKADGKFPSDNDGYISTFLLTLGLGFISGVVAVLAYLFISRG